MTACSRPGRRLLLNTGALTGSNLGRIAVSFALQLLVARRLGLESLGVYTVAMAWLNVCQVVSEAGLPMLLVRDLAQSPALRRAYARQALGMQLAAAGLVAALLTVLVTLLPVAPALRWALWAVGASLPFYAVTSVGETLFQAAERMELLLAVETTINLLILLLSVGVLWQQGTVVHLLAVVVLAQAVSAGLVAWLVARTRLLAPPQTAAALPWTRLAHLARPFFGLSLTDVLLQRLDILLISLWGSQVVGLYSAVYALIRVATKLIQSVWRALYPTLSRLYHAAAERYGRLAGRGLQVGLPACLGAAALGAVLAEPVLHLVYGADFGGAAPVLRVSVWILPLFWVESAAVTRLLVEARPRAGLVLSVLHVAGLAVLIPLLTPLAGAVGAAWAALVAQAVAAAAGLWLLRGGLRAPGARGR
jgi:O-antigen/teichoic acid export membrane protein